jgi:hypothetical protein
LFVPSKIPVSAISVSVIVSPVASTFDVAVTVTVSPEVVSSAFEESITFIPGISP